MAFLSWHERYSVGDAEMDRQHLRLFELVNHFDDVIQMGMSTELGLIVNDLVSCANEHFRSEEDLREKAGFPGLSDHRKMHQELIRQVQEVRAQMKAGGHLSMKAVVRFLADWLTNHILREDMEFKPYLNR